MSEVSKKILKQIDYLIGQVDKLIITQSGSGTSRRVETELFYSLRASSLSFILKLFGNKHPYYIEFEEHVYNSYYYHATIARGILQEIQNELHQGWLFSIKGLISAEIFTDFLEMSEYLLMEDFKDSAAVMIGGVLEEHLRQLCRKYDIPTEKSGSDRPLPIKANQLNNELAKAEIYNMLDMKSVQAQLDLRNKAAHAKYTEYTKEQVDIMYTSVTDFITRNPI